MAGRTSAPASGMPEVVEEPLYREPLSKDKVRIFRDETQRLRLTVEGDRSFLDLRVASAFPLSEPFAYMALLDGKERCIAMIHGLDGLDAESRSHVEQAISDHYFIPDIKRIDEMKEEFGVVYCDMMTDRGFRHFLVRGIRDSIEFRRNGEIFISDTDGNRYRIRSLTQLDARSRSRLDNFL